MYYNEQTKPEFEVPATTFMILKLYQYRLIIENFFKPFFTTETLQK